MKALLGQLIYKIHSFKRACDTTLTTTIICKRENLKSKVKNKLKVK